MEADLLNKDLTTLKQRLLFGCRLCLDETELKVNLDSDAGSSSQKLYEIANHYMDMGISPADEESTHACLSCAGKLIAFKQFHDACKATEKTIHAISNTIRIRKLMGEATSGPQVPRTSVASTRRETFSPAAMFGAASLRCFDCSASFYNQAELDEHKRSVHSAVFAQRRAGQVLNPVAAVLPLRNSQPGAWPSSQRESVEVMPDAVVRCERLESNSSRNSTRNSPPLRARKKENLRCGQCGMKFESREMKTLHDCSSTSSLRARPASSMKKPIKEVKLVACRYCTFKSNQKAIALHEAFKHRVKDRPIKGGDEDEDMESGSLFKCPERGCDYVTKWYYSVGRHAITNHNYTTIKARRLTRELYASCQQKVVGKADKDEEKSDSDCPYCEMSFRTKQGLIAHLWRVHQKTNIRTPVKKKTILKTTLKTTKPIQSLLSCPKCNYKTTFWKLVYHLNRNHRYTQSDARVLVNEIRNNNGEKKVPKKAPKGTFKCRFCSSTHHLKSGLKRHMTLKHLNEMSSSELVSCPIRGCDARFSSECSITYHLKLHHK